MNHLPYWEYLSEYDRIVYFYVFPCLLDLRTSFDGTMLLGLSHLS